MNNMTQYMCINLKVQNSIILNNDLNNNMFKKCLSRALF